MISTWRAASWTGATVGSLRKVKDRAYTKQAEAEAKVVGLLVVVVVCASREERSVWMIPVDFIDETL